MVTSRLGVQIVTSRSRLGDDNESCHSWLCGWLATRSLGLAIPEEADSRLFPAEMPKLSVTQRSDDSCQEGQSLGVRPNPCAPDSCKSVFGGGCGVDAKDGLISAGGCVWDSHWLDRFCVRQSWQARI